MTKFGILIALVVGLLLMVGKLASPNRDDYEVFEYHKRKIYFPKKPYHGMRYHNQEYDTYYVYNVYSNSWVIISKEAAVNTMQGKIYVGDHTCDKCGIRSDWGTVMRCPWCDNKSGVPEYK